MNYKLSDAISDDSIYLVSPDLNAQVNQGLFFCQSPTNSPVSSDGYLLVIEKNDSERYCKQVFYPINSNTTYDRYITPTEFSAWDTNYSSQNKPNYSDLNVLGAVPFSDGLALLGHGGETTTKLYTSTGGIYPRTANTAAVGSTSRAFNSAAFTHTYTKHLHFAEMGVGVQENYMSWTGGGMKRITTQGGFGLYSDSGINIHAGDAIAGSHSGLYMNSVASDSTGEDLYLTADSDVVIQSNWQSGASTAKTFRFDNTGEILGTNGTFLNTGNYDTWVGGKTKDNTWTGKNVFNGTGVVDGSSNRYGLAFGSRGKHALYQWGATDDFWVGDVTNINLIGFSGGKAKMYESGTMKTIANLKDSQTFQGAITSSSTISGTQIIDNGSRVYSPSNRNIGTGSTNYAAGNHTHSYIPINGSGSSYGNKEFCSTDVNGNYGNAAIEIREYNKQGNSNMADELAPKISFHWSGNSASTISMHNGGNFYFKSGTNTANYVAIYAGNVYDNGQRVFSHNNRNIGTGSTNYSAGNHTHDGRYIREDARTDGYMWVRRSTSSGSVAYFTQQSTANIVEFRQGATDGTVRSYINNDGVFVGNVLGSASSLSTSRTISLTGSATGSVSFDGSSNVSINTHVNKVGVTDTRAGALYPNDYVDSSVTFQFTNQDVPSPHTSWTSAITVKGWGDNYQVWQLLSGASTSANGALIYRRGVSTTWQSTQRIFMDDYHPNADKWTTARTLSLSGDASGSVSWDGSANATLSVTVANNSHTHTTGNITYFTTRNIDTDDMSKFWSSNISTSTTHGTKVGSYYFYANLGGNNTKGIQLASPYSATNALYYRKGSDNSGSENGKDKWNNWRRIFDENYHPYVQVNTSSTTTYHSILWHSGNTVYSSNGKFKINPNSGWLLLDCGTTSAFNIVSDDGGESSINLYGSSQGTGRVFVGQSSTYGGGIEYNGDNNPATTGAGADMITLYRKNNGTFYWTARNSVSNADWEFRGNVTAYSDIRVKENIERIENALDKVTKLGGYTYNRTDGETKRQTGVIAQEVLEVLPEAVIQNGGEDSMYSVAYGNMVGLLIEAVKEEREERIKLEERLEKLEKLLLEK